MSPPQPSWLAGLRRAWITSGALSRWASERDITGVVWTPSSYELEDIAEGLVALVASGAKPDASLLWDFTVEDARAAADMLGGTYRSSEGRTGYVTVWLDPGRLNDAGKAARELISDVRRANVAAGLAWSADRAKAIESIVAAGVPVAIAGVRDASARDAIAGARVRGMARCRETAKQSGQAPESIPEVPVFLLGGDGEDGDAVFTVTLTTELALYSPVAAAGARLPASPEAEQAGVAAVLDALARRAAEPARSDRYDPPSFALAVAGEAKEIAGDDLLNDIWSRDHTAWRDDPAEIADRLGWLDVPELMRQQLGDLQEFARRTRSGGEVDHIVLCGMGGSSLAPETLRSVCGGGLPLTVLDTTHPGYIASVTASLDIDKTVFVVASKSGTTVETRAQFEYFWKLSGRGDRFVAITDPGTELAALATERGFARVFSNPPDIGGRFSALSYFGLVPSVLAGVDLTPILDGALRAIARNGPGVAGNDAPAVRLAAALGEAKLSEGRDKLTFSLPRPIAAFGPWVEQLIAESTGKQGNGLLPVVGEELAPPIAYSPDRVFCVYTIGDAPEPPTLEALEGDHPVVRLGVAGPHAIGAEMYRWEMATAITGYLLDINPFDQPDVESAKQRARDLLGSPAGSRPDPGSAADLLSSLVAPKYLALQAFVAPTPENTRRLDSVRTTLRDRHKVAVTVGFGPRYLHSTGQFHKGGPDTGVFVQVTEPRSNDLDIPGMGFTFGRLFDAQADGDMQALRDASRPVARISLEELERLANA